MAMISNSNATAITDDHSPRPTIAADNTNNNISSPQSRRAAAKPVSPPWTRIVRGAESESVSAAAAPSVVAEVQEDSMETESNASKRPVWNKPSTISNGTVSVDIGTVMGADSWPALSASAARVSSMKSSSDSLRSSLTDGSPSLSVPQGTGTASSSSQKQVSNSTNPNSTPNHTAPVRQRSMKRNSANTSSNGGASQPPGSQGPAAEVHLNNTSPGDHGQKGSQSRSSSDHPQQQRNSFRNRNGGPHSRGDGSHHHNYGGRRNDQDRANQDWSAHRNFNSRDGHMQPSPRVAPRLVRHPPPPPPPPASFIPPPPVRPFAPMGFPEMAPPLYYVTPHPESIRGVPIIPTPIPHAVFMPPPDLQLHSKIANQIDYYFSNENLIKDTFLRQNMDDQGWVPIKLIAGFNKVSHLTDNIQLILDAIRNSSIVETQGEKVRRRNDWMRWIMPTSFPNVPSPQSGAKSSHDILAAHVQGISLDEKATDYKNSRSLADVRTEAFLGRSSSGDLNSHSQLSSSEGTDEVSVHGSLERPTPARISSK